MCAVSKFLEAFAVWFCAFISRADEQARVLEERAVKSARLPIDAEFAAFHLEVIVNARGLGELGLGVLDAVIRASCRC